MKNFIKMTLATLTGLLLFGGVVTFIFAGIIGAAASLGKQQAVVPDSAVLTMDMSTVMIMEQTQEPDPMSMLQGNGMEISPLGIYSAIRAINIAAQDPAIKFIYMKPDGVMGGLAQIEELRTALKHFRESGKAVVSYMENPTNAGYYLASVSDKIYMTVHDGGISPGDGKGNPLQYSCLENPMDR